MTALTDQIAVDLRDYITDGDPESGDYSPLISDIRDILTTMATGAQFIDEVEDFLNAASVADARTAIALGSGSTPTFAGLNVTDDLAVNSNVFFVDGGGERVGVGTALPQTGLHVALPALFDDEVEFDSTVTIAGTMTVDGATGKIVVGAASPPTIGSLLGGENLSVAGTDAGGSVAVSRWSNDTTGPRVTLMKARSTAVGTYTQIQTGDELGSIRFNAANGSTYAEGARIAALAGSSLSETSQPTFLVFYTTRNSATTATETMRLDNAGRILVGATASITTGVAMTEQIHGTSASSGYAATVWANASTGPSYVFAKSRGAAVGTQVIAQTGDTVGQLRFYADNGTTFDQAATIRVDVDGTPTADMPGRIVFLTTPAGSTTPTERLRIQADGTVRPGADNAQTLGGVSQRWSVVYAATGTINTSDENEKLWLGAMTTAERNAAGRIAEHLGSFKWLASVAQKGQAARRHFGVTAQEVAAAFTAEGLDPAGYGMWCEDTFTDPVTHQSVTRQGIRPDQLNMFLCAAGLARLAELDARIAALEAA